MQVADIAAGSLAAVRVFESFGIDYCCGGKRPLAEVCEEKGLDAGEVQRALDAATRQRPAEERDWNSAPLRELIAHILDTPAAGQAARDRAEQLRNTLAGTALSTPSRPLEHVLASVWNIR